MRVYGRWTEVPDGAIDDPEAMQRFWIHLTETAKKCAADEGHTVDESQPVTIRLVRQGEHPFAEDDDLGFVELKLVEKT